jgi:hypothetical protein
LYYALPIIMAVLELHFMIVYMKGVTISASHWQYNFFEFRLSPNGDF